MLTPRRKGLKPGEKVSLSLTLAQANLIVESTLLSESLAAMIHAARVRDNTVRARCTLGEVEALAGCVAAIAKATQDTESQRILADIAEAISQVEQAHYYHVSANGRSRTLKLAPFQKA